MFRNFHRVINDDVAQGSVELILIVGGIIVIVLVIVSMYNQYIVGFGDEIESNEIKTLNDSFKNISSKFE